MLNVAQTALISNPLYQPIVSHPKIYQRFWHTTIYLKHHFKNNKIKQFGSKDCIIQFSSLYIYMQLPNSNHIYHLTNIKDTSFVMEKTKENSDDDVAFSEAMQLSCSSVLPMALRAAVELGLFEIIAASSQKFLSPEEIASQITKKNANAPVVVERILRFLASASVLKYEVIKKSDGERLLYGLSPVCKYFVGDKDGVSLAPFFLMLQDKVIIDAGYHLKDAVVDGVNPFNKAHGTIGYEYMAKDHRFNELFNQAMYSLTTINMNKIFEVYTGFEGLKQVVDVGGGTGANLAAIVSRYPNINGINFDLPHVIKHAPPCRGIKHVAGDMFESIPSGDAIFLKDILHSWTDDECVELLKNCHKALPKTGKVIVVDALVPQYPHTDNISNNVFCYDINMLIMSPGGREKTEKEFDILAKRAGFARTKVICNVHIKGVIEFYKI